MFVWQSPLRDTKCLKFGSPFEPVGRRYSVGSITYPQREDKHLQCGSIYASKTGGSSALLLALILVAPPSATGRANRPTFYAVDVSPTATSHELMQLKSGDFDTTIVRAATAEEKEVATPSAARFIFEEK